MFAATAAADDDRGTKAERDGAKADAEAANVEATKARENFMAVVVRMVLVLVGSSGKWLNGNNNDLTREEKMACVCLRIGG